jgi:hypothetical protein
MVRRRGARWAIAGGIVALALVGLGVAAFQPWTANHFGYGLPGPRGLPYRIAYGGRDFSNPGMCAGADWCQHPTPPNAGNCRTQADLMGAGWWPLHQVGTVSTLVGPPYPYYSIGSSGASPGGLLLFVRLTSDCYIGYALEGGP